MKLTRKREQQIERKIERLTDQAVKILDRLNKMELTFSRLKNEGDDLLRNLLKAKVE